MGGSGGAGSTQASLVKSWGLSECVDGLWVVAVPPVETGALTKPARLLECTQFGWGWFEGTVRGCQGFLVIRKRGHREQPVFHAWPLSDGKWAVYGSQGLEAFMPTLLIVRPVRLYHLLHFFAMWEDELAMCQVEAGVYHV